MLTERGVYTLQIWSHLLKKSLMENFILCAVIWTHSSYSLLRNLGFFAVNFHYAGQNLESSIS